MSFSRNSKYAGIRCPGHDYRSRCIYHIVLKKADYIPVFSEVVGFVGNHTWPPTVKLSETGQIIANCLSKLKNQFPFISILRKCIMPDHVHIALFVKEESEFHLGQIVAELKRKCSSEFEALTHNNGKTEIFIPGYHDTFLSGNNQLKAMLAYISDNPRRHLVRKLNEGWFHRFTITDGKDRYEAYGNWDLLSEFQKVRVKYSRKYNQAELNIYKKLWHRTILNDGILVSPFIHSEEKKVRDWAIDNGGVLIYITYKPFTDRYKPSGKLFELCSEGRLMIVSFPIDFSEQECIRNHGSPSYTTCQKMNELALKISNNEFVLSYDRPIS